MACHRFAMVVPGRCPPAGPAYDHDRGLILPSLSRSRRNPNIPFKLGNRRGGFLMTDIDHGNVRRLDVTPPAGATFWAERDPAIQWRSTAMMLVLMAPLAFIAPGNFISAAVAVAAMGWWNARGFRLEVNRQALRLK